MYALGNNESGGVQVWPQRMNIELSRTYIHFGMIYYVCHRQLSNCGRGLWGPSSNIHYTLRLNNKETLPVQAMTLYLLVIFFKSIFFLSSTCSKKEVLPDIRQDYLAIFLRKTKKISSVNKWPVFPVSE